MFLIKTTEMQGADREAILLGVMLNHSLAG